MRRYNTSGIKEAIENANKKASRWQGIYCRFGEGFKDC